MTNFLIPYLDRMCDYEFCPKGHKRYGIVNSSLHSPYRYCEECDCFYVPSAEKVSKEDIQERFVDETRVQKMIELAVTKTKRSLVSYKDLQKLGYVA